MMKQLLKQFKEEINSFNGGNQEWGISVDFCSRFCDFSRILDRIKIIGVVYQCGADLKVEFGVTQIRVLRVHN